MDPQKAYIKKEDIPHLEKLVKEFEDLGWGVKIVGDAQLSEYYDLLGLQIYGNALHANEKRNDVLNIAKNLSEYKFSEKRCRTTKVTIIHYKCPVLNDIAYDVETGATPIRIAHTRSDGGWHENLEFLGLKDNNPSEIIIGNRINHHNRLEEGEYQKGVNLSCST